MEDKKATVMLMKDWVKKIVIIVIGSIIAAYGITLALYAGFGGATLAVLWQGISKTAHISIGMASFVVALGMIIFAVGTGLYASVSLGRGSYEAVTFALGFFIYSIVSVLTGIPYGIDITIATVGIVITSISTIFIKL